MNIRHFVDRAGFSNQLVAGTINYFDGWAVNEEKKDPVIEIQFTINGKRVGSLPIRKDRPDLIKSFGSSLHGFSGVVDFPDSAVAQKVTLEAVTTKGERTTLGEYEIKKRLEENELRFRKENNLPGDLLMHLVVHNVNPRSFLEEGKLAVELILKILHEHNVQLNEIRSVLDFGVGCGRVMRWWSETGLKADFYGTDINLSLIDWCRLNLKFGAYQTNKLGPPTSYRSSQFDIIYAFSVFTHLGYSTQQEWLSEYSRILSPGKHLILSVHGDYHAKLLAPEVQVKYARDGFLVLSEDVEGENMCAAYQSKSTCEELFEKGFEILAFYPQALQSCGNQDLYLLKSKKVK